MSQEDFELVAASLEADSEIEVYRDPNGKVNKEKTFVIKKLPEEPIGTYMGMEFYEWLDMEDCDTGKVDRWFYVQSIESRWKIDLRSNQIVCGEHFVYECPTDAQVGV